MILALWSSNLLFKCVKNDLNFILLYFLQDHWPKEIHLRDNDKLLHTLKKIKEDSSFISIYTHLWENVPRIHDAVMAMESRLADCSILLKNHASKIFEWNSIISRTSKPYFFMHKVIVICLCVYSCVCVFLMKNEILRYKISQNININLFYFKTSSFQNGPVWIFSWTFEFKENSLGQSLKQLWTLLSWSRSNQMQGNKVTLTDIGTRDKQVGNIKTGISAI